MLNRETIELLWCPDCRADGMRAEGSFDGDQFLEGKLHCDGCQAAFCVESGIPNLRTTASENAESWDTWRKHLDGFEARRLLRAGAPRPEQEERWSKKIEAFADFIDVPDGRLLDVGCGPGNLRKLLDANRVTYHGVDPLPVDGVEAFPFACALAESLPFRGGTFHTVVVRSALDHFYDLDAFFREANRVLVDDGRMFLEQVIHGGRSVTGLVKNAVHSAKDVLDNVRTLKDRDSAPKHMRDFTRDSLMNSIKDLFEIDRYETYDSTWYTPTQVFVSLRCHAAQPV